jgi:hypothetical protein
MAKAGECPVMPLRLGRKLVWPTMGVLRSVGLAGDGEAPPAEDGASEVIDIGGRQRGDRGGRS